MKKFILLILMLPTMIVGFIFEIVMTGFASGCDAASEFIGYLLDETKP